MVLREIPAISTRRPSSLLQRAGQAMRWMLSVAVPMLAPPQRMGYTTLAPRGAGSDLQQPLRQLMHEVLIPTLAARERSALLPLPPSDGRAEELARLLLKGELQEVDTLLRQAMDRAASLPVLISETVEPTARVLGDLWRDDGCLCFDVTLGLCHLQAAVRRLDSSPRLPARSCSALMVPAPGEMHALSAALHGDLAWQEGWTARVDFPASDDALQALLARQWFDLLDISLSPAFSREHSLPVLAATIARVRRATLNPELLIVASGRVFIEDPAAGHRVGADESSRSAEHFCALLNQVASARN